VSTVTITVELTPEQAAALVRLTDKTGHSEAMALLYPHVSKEVRDRQVSHVLGACDRVIRALGEAGCGSWPWIESGRP
jgi:hypothetical protein